jgi:chemotaxis protein MotB
VGHTDNVPIRPAARKRFPSNWELSTARATAAVRFLTEEAGIDPRRLGAVGYGEFRPVADNATPEGRAHNRRIAITILSDEMVGADTVPTATLSIPPTPAVGPTNAPAALQGERGRVGGSTNGPAARHTAVGPTTNSPGPVPPAEPSVPASRTVAGATTNATPEASKTETNAPGAK